MAGQPALQQQFQKENSITTTVIKKCWQKSWLCASIFWGTPLSVLISYHQAKTIDKLFHLTLTGTGTHKKIKCNNVQIWLEFQAPRSRHWGFLLFSAIRGMLYKQILPKKFRKSNKRFIWPINKCNKFVLHSVMCVWPLACCRIKVS